MQIAQIQPGALHANNSQDVAPLAVGHFAALAIPTQFLEKDVLGRMDIQDPAGDLWSRFGPPPGDRPRRSQPIQRRDLRIGRGGQLQAEGYDRESEYLLAGLGRRVALPDTGECEFTDGLAHAQ